MYADLFAAVAARQRVCRAAGARGAQTLRRDPEGSLLTARSRGPRSLCASGARVILPSVVEVGGKVRITAEVVDPSTRPPFSPESADGEGAPSTLDSPGRVSDRVRERPRREPGDGGEEFAALPQVTTTSLDALRAYALAPACCWMPDSRRPWQAVRSGAATLDPQFAMVPPWPRLRLHQQRRPRCGAGRAGSDHAAAARPVADARGAVLRCAPATSARRPRCWKVEVVCQPLPRRVLRP